MPAAGPSTLRTAAELFRQHLHARGRDSLPTPTQGIRSRKERGSRREELPCRGDLSKGHDGELCEFFFGRELRELDEQEQNNWSNR
jgi:hypothetical protein